MKAALVEPRSIQGAIIEISPELLLSLLKVDPKGEVVNGGRVRAVEDVIPTHAKALRCGISPHGNVLLLVTSEEFDETPEGEKLPRLQPVYEISAD